MEIFLTIGLCFCLIYTNSMDQYITNVKNKVVTIEKKDKDRDQLHDFDHEVINFRLKRLEENTPDPKNPTMNSQGKVKK